MMKTAQKLSNKIKFVNYLPTNSAKKPLTVLDSYHKNRVQMYFSKNNEKPKTTSYQ